MNIVGVGVDVVEVKRLKDARHFKRVTDFFLLPEEVALMLKSRDQVQFAASRFAAKEAVIKACPERLWYHDFVVVKEGEKLYVRFCRSLKREYKVFVSIAHETSYVVSGAVVGL